MSRPPRLSRNAAIVLGVVGFHVLAIIGLQTGLLKRAVELVVPVEMVAAVVEAPQARVAPPPPAPPRPQVVKPVTQPQPRPPRPVPAPVLAPVQSDEPPPPTAPVVVEAPPAPPAPVAAPAQNTAPPAPPAPPSPAPPAPATSRSPRIELPNSDAAYLNNPRPRYPAVSARLREVGTVLVRVLVSADGAPRRVELEKSSGFERLDQAALKIIPQWRFIPGKRNGVAEEMWVEVPMAFDLANK